MKGRQGNNLGFLLVFLCLELYVLVLAVQWVIQWSLKGKLVEYCEEKNAMPQGHSGEQVQQESLLAFWC